MLKRVLTYVFAMLATVTAVSSATLEEAKEMYLAGDYARALPVFHDYLKKKPKDGSLNHWYGVCLMQSGMMQEAKPYLEYAHGRKVVQSSRYLAEIAFYEYDVDKADLYMESYRSAMKKAKKELPEDAADLSDRIGKMRAMLDRVEQIEIIDSLSVDADDFFRFYKLSAESGSLNSPEILPTGYESASPTVVYRTENKATMMWSMPDDNENYCLVSSSLLIDGQWERPRVLGERLNEGGDANYPFLMSDGVTLYFANTGENSLGGYDIFISRRDENEFLNPQNVGMPYNSPYDDYMLAIDETTGVGWWATDRNRIDGKLTIYKFVPREMRKNYPVDAPNLCSLARIDSYRATWSDGADYSALLEAVDKLDDEREIVSHDFEFALPGGLVYTKWSDFKSADAKAAMQEYLDAVSRHNADKVHLETLRVRYAGGESECAEEIKALEQKIRNDYTELRHLSNDVVRLEIY